MSHRSKQEVTPRRCKVCGRVEWLRKGTRRKECPWCAPSLREVRS